MLKIIELRIDEPKESILEKLHQVIDSAMGQLVNCDSLEGIKTLEDRLDQLFSQVVNLKNYDSDICELMAATTKVVKDNVQHFDDLQALKKLREVPYRERISKASEVLKRHSKARNVVYKTAKYVFLDSLIQHTIFDEHIDTEEIRAELSNL